MAYLPFEALLTRQPTAQQPNYRRLPYVLDTLAVSYAPSSQVLIQGASGARHAMRFLAFGYSGSDALAETPLSTTWRGLPGTAREIKALNQMAEGTFYTGAAASESQFKAEAERYDVIHLAVHGLADTLQPNNSRLVFRTEHDSINDGNLYSYELYDLQLQADLAVLSACESGTGKLQQGEGVYSLARGFTYAGCPTVVMSLWRVDDQQTASLMPTFYRALFAGQPVDQALRAGEATVPGAVRRLLRPSGLLVGLRGGRHRYAHHQLPVDAPRRCADPATLRNIHRLGVVQPVEKPPSEKDRQCRWTIKKK